MNLKKSFVIEVKKVALKKNCRMKLILLNKIQQIWQWLILILSEELLQLSNCFAWRYSLSSSLDIDIQC